MGQLLILSPRLRRRLGFMFDLSSCIEALRSVRTCVHPSRKCLSVSVLDGAFPYRTVSYVKGAVDGEPPAGDAGRCHGARVPQVTGTEFDFVSPFTFRERFLFSHLSFLSSLLNTVVHFCSLNDVFLRVCGIHGMVQPSFHPIWTGFGSFQC